MKTFKFFSTNRKPISLTKFKDFSPEDRGFITKGYYDAFDAHHNHFDLEVPYHPIDEENEYTLWQMGVDMYEQNPIPRS